MQTLAHIARAPAVPDPGADPAAADARDPVFDAWLKRELTRLFDTVRSEPLPEEMLRLLGA